MNISEANATSRLLQQVAFLPVEQQRDLPTKFWDDAEYLAQRAEDRLKAGYVRQLIAKARERAA